MSAQNEFAGLGGRYRCSIRGGVFKDGWRIAPVDGAFAVSQEDTPEIVQLLSRRELYSLAWTPPQCPSGTGSGTTSSSRVGTLAVH